MKQLNILATVKNKGVTVGYIIKDKNKEIYIDKYTLWRYINTERFKNVKALGTEEHPIIKGIGNFSISKLNYLKWHKNINLIYQIDKKLTDEDMYLALIRHLINGNKVCVPTTVYDIQSFSSILAKNEIALGVINIISETNKNILSKHLAITNSIVDYSHYQGKLNIDMNTCYDKYEIVGYRVRNMSNWAINYISYRNKNKSIQQIKPNETVDLSVTDLVMLASRIEINGLLANAKIYFKHDTKEIGLTSFGFVFTSFDYIGLPLELKHTIKNSMYNPDIMLNAQDIRYNV